MPATPLKARCRRLLVEPGLCKPDDALITGLIAGGIVRHCGRVLAGDQALVNKVCPCRAKGDCGLARAVHRNSAEYAWLMAASHVVPASVPRLYGRSDREGGFTMEFIEGERVYLWKAALLASAPDRNEAALVGAVMGQIHAASAQPGFDATPFRNHDDFHAIRLEPYLAFVANQHPPLANRLYGLADRHYRADRVLLHGDVSLKSILFRGNVPVILDAECATMGDASFDVAFCLNHLILKA